jgi:predicted RNase H-like nuclease (RuvC/YqgF family)
MLFTCVMKDYWFRISTFITLCFFLSSNFKGGSSEQMVAAVTAEIQVQVDAMEELSPTIDPLQTEIAALKKQSSDLQDEIAALKVKVASAATEKDSKEDVISNTTNDIKILREAIEMKRAELEPLPAKIEVMFEKRIGGGV